MKRILIILCVFANIGFTYAQELNSAQSKLRNDIKSFLQQEGFVPSIDSDGDVVFKSEGNSFWVSVSAADDVPMYTSLNIGFTKPDDYSLTAMKLAAAELNYYKGVKVLCFEDSFTFRSELYVMNAEQFKYSFYTMLAHLKTVADAFVDTYEKYKDSSSGSSSSQSSSRSQLPYSSSSYSTSSSNLRTVSSKYVNITVGEQVQLIVYGQTVKKWESDNSTIARVSDSGVLTGVASGLTTVWANYGSELKLFRVAVNGSSNMSSSSSSSTYSSSSSSCPSRAIYSKEATVKVGERIFAQLSEGRVDNWEISSTAAQFVTTTSDGALIAIKAGCVNIWGYVDASPKLFKLTIVGTGSYVPQDRAPYLVTSTEFTMYVGDQITAKISDGEISRWEIEKINNDYFTVDGKVLRAKKAGTATIWGYVNGSPKYFKITIKSR